MHELSLAAEILRLVQASAARDAFSRVATLRLEAGALAGVEVSALRFALDAIAPGTCLDGAAIQIDQPAGRAWCSGCAAEVEIASRADPCPVCGGAPLRPTGGSELRVLDLVVQDD
ncbi:MAG: hydrogenase maturation nickel metallochaperone HypA [Burkholderiaceae bacterium]|nr:hydrogenase maturation nickel metallochaperone HypA [Burkholderiaceae bacterium]